MIHGTGEQEHSKDYNVPGPHDALGYRPPSLEAIRGQVSRSRASGPLPAPTRVSPAATTQYKQDHQNDQQGFHISSPPTTFFPRRVGLSLSGRVLLVWFSPSTLRPGPERCLVDLRPMPVALLWPDSTLTNWADCDWRPFSLGHSPDVNASWSEK
jgi:hypothetical protein